MLELFLDKNSFYHQFKIKEKLYEIKSRDFLDMSPYVILHPGRAFIDAVPKKPWWEGWKTNRAI